MGRIECATIHIFSSCLVLAGCDGDSHANNILSSGKEYVKSCKVQINAKEGLLLDEDIRGRFLSALRAPIIVHRAMKGYLLRVPSNLHSISKPPQFTQPTPVSGMSQIKTKCL